MGTEDLDARDRELIEAATEVIRRNHREGRHSVGAAVRCASGKVYVGVDVETTAYGPCAEPVAIGAAVSRGEREFVSIVAVGLREGTAAVIPPCGNCRQLLIDYAPNSTVILLEGAKLVKRKARDLLPLPYQRFESDSPGNAG
jgi:cytidine deaminase